MMKTKKITQNQNDKNKLDLFETIFDQRYLFWYFWRQNKLFFKLIFQVFISEISNIDNLY